MNDKAKVILWLGIALLAVQVIRAWPVLSALFFTPSGNSGSGGLGNIGQFANGIGSGIAGAAGIPPGAAQGAAGAAGGIAGAATGGITLTANRTR